MAKGSNLTQRINIIDSYDPRITGRAAQKGTIFLYIPAVGDPEILIKDDEGFSTNWESQGSSNGQPNVYYVGTHDFPTIQSAIDQAFADGSGTAGKIVTILVPPGQYVENLVFRPGQGIIAQASQIAIGAVQIFGQHTYTPPVNGNPLGVALNLQGLSFRDSQVGNTIEILGTNGAFISINGCSFIKSSATGSSIVCSNTNGIFIVGQSSTTGYVPSDAFIKSNAQVTVIQQCSQQGGPNAPLLDYLGNGTCQFQGNNAIVQNGAYIASFAGGTIFAQQNFLASFFPNGDCLRVASPALMYLTNNTLVSQFGTGFVLQGDGTVNGTLIAYGGSTDKDPSLTFNLLPSDPP